MLSLKEVGGESARQPGGLKGGNRHNIRKTRTHPPLKAPIGLRIGIAADGVSSLRDDTWKVRADWRDLGIIEAGLGMRRDRGTSLVNDAMVFFAEKFSDLVFGEGYG